MIHISSSVTIRRPVEVVFDWVSNPERHTDWQLELVEIAHYPQEKRLVEVRRILGRRIEHRMEIVEHEENRLIRHRGGAETHEIDRVYTFVESAGATVLTIDVNMASIGVFAMAVPTLERMLKRQIVGSLLHLKDILEAHPDLQDMAEQLPKHESRSDTNNSAAEPVD